MDKPIVNGRYGSPIRSMLILNQTLYEPMEYPVRDETKAPETLRDQPNGDAAVSGASVVVA